MAKCECGEGEGACTASLRDANGQVWGGEGVCTTSLRDAKCGEGEGRVPPP